MNVISLSVANVRTHIRASVELYIARKAAGFLQPRVKSLVFNVGPTVYDPMDEVGGWISGDGWYINVGHADTYVAGRKTKKEVLA